MRTYFNLKFEFDHAKVDQIIKNAIHNKEKGYVCSVEGNVLATANSNISYLNVVNNALVNICDGSSIAFLLSLIHLKKFKAYIGADLFIEYIKMAKYRSFFLGNTEQVLEGLRSNLIQYDQKISQMKFMTLPFKDINEFDYKGIGQIINDDNPDIIWVSLGAPKQEMFMSNLLPHIKRGVMFGIGAILNFYSSSAEEKRAPRLLLKFRLEWIYRLYINPKKQLPKIRGYFSNMPTLIYHEIRKKHVE